MNAYRTSFNQLNPDLNRRTVLAILGLAILALLLSLWQLNNWQPTRAHAYGVKARKLTTVKAVTPKANFNLPVSQPIPILMYHYIRDFSSPKDKIGTNLSVSPTTFTKQLQALKDLGYQTVTFKDLGQPLPAKPIILTFDDGYADAYTAALPALKDRGMKGVFYLISGFLNKPNYLSHDQVKSMVTDGMEIGAHTVNHKELNKLSEADQHMEIERSKKTLEELTGQPVISFCYPSGRYSSLTLQITHDAGYTTGATTKPGIAKGRDFNNQPFELHRVRVMEKTDLMKILRIK